MKQQQKIIKKGDYYEIQTIEQAIMMITKSKKQESQQQQSYNSTSNIPTQLIQTQIPSFKEARSKYYCPNLKKEYEQKNVADLREELEEMIKDETLRDEDRKQIQTLIQEIDSFRNFKEIPLNDLPASKQPQQQQAKQQPFSKVNLTAKYNVNALSKRIQVLESLQLPDLVNLQHQLEIMLGEKKPLQSLELSSLDQRQRQDINNLYNHLSNLTIMNSTAQTIQDITLNEQKHVEMQQWAQRSQKVQDFNNDFLKQLKQDQEIVQRLETNFNQNVKQVRQILKQLKGK